MKYILITISVIFNLKFIESSLPTIASRTVTVGSDIPASIDWRSLGAVTPIKNQGVCAATWAFAANSALEGQIFRKTGKLISLSEQNLIDCTRPYGNQGCQAGWMGYAFRYVLKNKGLDTTYSYPYLNSTSNQTCKYNSSNSGGTISKYVNLPSGDEIQLTKAIAQIGPIACSMDASDIKFRNYKSGIYNSTACSSYNLNHGVTLVGYGGSGNSTYYIGKNSWSVNWGENGFFRIARSWVNKTNLCGIASACLFPLI